MCFASTSPKGIFSRNFGVSSAVLNVVSGSSVGGFWNDVTVTVTHVMPMHIPGAGRLLGDMDQPKFFYARQITSRATLPLEAPKSADRRLGIPYDPELADEG